MRMPNAAATESWQLRLLPVLGKMDGEGGGRRGGGGGGGAGAEKEGGGGEGGAGEGGGRQKTEKCSPSSFLNLCNQ